MQLSIAHKIALWTRCDAKHFPDLKEVYEDIDKAQEKSEGEVKTPDKMLEIVKSLNIKFGGEG